MRSDLLIYFSGLRPGDLVTHINGEPVQGLFHTQVLQILMSGGEAVTLRATALQQTSIKTGGRRRDPQVNFFYMVSKVKDKFKLFFLVARPSRWLAEAWPRVRPNNGAKPVATTRPGRPPSSASCPARRPQLRCNSWPRRTPWQQRPWRQLRTASLAAVGSVGGPGGRSTLRRHGRTRRVPTLQLCPAPQQTGHQMDKRPHQVIKLKPINSRSIYLHSFLSQS